jgi:hypothetical protein
MRQKAILLAVLMVAAHGLALAQTSTDVVQSQTYRLTDKSLYQNGCFGPCLCPVLISSAMVGTFKLTPAAPDPLFKVYNVTDVNWLARVNGADVRITGSGTYRIGGEFALTNELQLNLKVGDADVQKFDSGLVVGGSDFPAINLTISINGMVCFDTAITVAAVPVLSTEIQPYSLFQSLYEQGCFGPCLCAVSGLPVYGKFGLVKLGEDSGIVTFGVVDVNWRVLRSPSAITIDAFPVTGFGLYQITSPPGKQRMLLDLTLDGKGPQRFDSGLVPGGDGLMRIDIMLAANGFACFDQVFNLHARPARPAVTLQSTTPERSRRGRDRRGGAISPLPPQ